MNESNQSSTKKSWKSKLATYSIDEGNNNNTISILYTYILKVVILYNDKMLKW